MKKYLLFLPLAFLASFGFSQTTYTWTGLMGPALNYWSFNNNWSPNTNYPKTGDIAIINNAIVQIGGNQQCKDVTLTGTSSLTVNSGVILEITGTMDVGVGTTLDISGGDLILLADASGAGRLGAIGGTITGGNLTVQSYLTSAAEWRILGAQIPGQTISNWDDDNGIYTSGFTGSDGSTVDNFISMYTYDESVPGIADSGYVAPSSDGDALTSGKGFLTWIQQGTDQVVSLSGAPNTGTVNLNVTYNNSGAGKANEGWNMVANPFTSAIDLTACTKTSMGSVFYVLNLSGNYTSTNIVAAGQGFWAQASGVTGSMSVPQSAKTTTTPGVNYFKTTPNNLVLKISSQINSYWDEAFISPDDNATLNYDEDIDAIKLFTPNPWEVPSLSLVSDDDIDLYKHVLPNFPVGETVDIPLRVKVGITGEYTIDITGFENVYTNHDVVLEDLSTGDFISVNNNSISYTFNIDNTIEQPRFVLHVTENPVSTGVESIDGKKEIVVYPNPAKDNLTFVFSQALNQNATILITNQLGAIVKNIPVNQGTNNINLNVNDLSQGLYNYQIVSENEIISNGKIVVQ